MFRPQDELDDPFAPPRSNPQPEPEVDPLTAIWLRQAHLVREIRIRLLALVGWVIAFFHLARAATWASIALELVEPADPVKPGMLVVAIEVEAFLAVAFAGLAWGLTRFQPWARLATTAACLLGLVRYLAPAVVAARLGMNAVVDRLSGSALSLALIVFWLYLLWSKEGRIVFSKPYRRAIRQTPEFRPLSLLNRRSRLIIGGCLLLGLYFLGLELSSMVKR